MRVLLLSQFYPPLNGGQEWHVRALADELARRGHHVEVATIAPGGAPVGTLHEGDVVVHRLGATTRRLTRLHSEPARAHVPPAPDPELQLALGRILRGGAFDVIHAHDWAVDSVIRPARRAGVPVVLTQHDYSHICATKRMMRGTKVCGGPSPGACAVCAGRVYGRPVGPAVALLNYLSSRRRGRAVSTFIPVSSSVAERTGVTAHEFEVVSNFVPEETISSSPPPAAPPSILYAGDVRFDKGVGVLFDAYERLEPRPPLSLAGRALGDVAAALPDGAVLLGELHHGELLSLMRTVLIVAVPSIYLDPNPTVVLEAMAAGRAVVAAASGGIPDLVEDGVTGLLVSPGDPVELSRALQSLIDDPELARELGRNGLERARSFSASRVVDRLLQRYELAMEQQR